MREDEVAGFRVYFDEGGKWVESPGFTKWSVNEDVRGPGAQGRKVSGQKKYTNIVLKRGADVTRLHPWRKEGPDRTYVRKDVLIELLDGQGAPIAMYAFKQGFPVKWQTSTVSAKGSEVTMEAEMMLAYESLEIT